MVKREAGFVLADQSGHLPGNAAHVNPRRSHAQNRGDEFLIRQGASTPFPKLLARAAVLRHVFNGFHDRDIFHFGRNSEIKRVVPLMRGLEEPSRAQCPDRGPP